MRLPAPGFLSLAAAAACLVGAGFAGGYLAGAARIEMPPAGGPAALPAPFDARAWADDALAVLVRDLDLNAGQTAAAVGVLRGAADRVNAERERALFQIHLQLLEVHDLLQSTAGFTGERKKRLADSREKLRNLILSRFADLLDSEGTIPPSL